MIYCAPYTDELSLSSFHRSSPMYQQDPEKLAYVMVLLIGIFASIPVML
jgi:hypothetical protein